MRERARPSTVSEREAPMCSSAPSPNVKRLDDDARYESNTVHVVLINVFESLLLVTVGTM